MKTNSVRFLLSLSICSIHVDNHIVINHSKHIVYSTEHSFIAAKSTPQSKNIYRIPISCLTGHMAPEKTATNHTPNNPSLLLAPVVSVTSTSPSLLRRSPMLRTKRLHVVTPEKVLGIHHIVVEGTHTVKSLILRGP